MSVDTMDKSGKQFSHDDGIQEVPQSSLESKSDLVLVKAVMDSVAYIYIRSHLLEAIIVARTADMLMRSAQAQVYKFANIQEIDEYVDDLIFDKEYTVIGGFDRDKVEIKFPRRSRGFANPE